MTKKLSLDLSEYQYDLPADRIAKYPLKKRDQSRLLVYQNGRIQHVFFHQLPDFLPISSLLFFNNTKVIPARLLFEKETGGVIEVFLLGPADPGASLGEALISGSPVTWKCTVGNAKRWAPGRTLMKSAGDIHLKTNWANKDKGEVAFSWTPSDIPFARIVNELGAVPLPPYLNRNAEVEDKDRYQTIYSRFEGAVAAPTAGLHFTQEIMEHIKKRGCHLDYLTLHVSAGTFVPIKETNVSRHVMHSEEIVVSRVNLENLLNRRHNVIAVGTTSLRTLESIYWYGVALSENPQAPFAIEQGRPYEKYSTRISPEESIDLVLKRMDVLGVDELLGQTSIYLMPGYNFRMVKGLITNFHQPGSSLLVLVAAFVGDKWKNIYAEAIREPYRFLSYGDSSLLLPN